MKAALCLLLVVIATFSVDAVQRDQSTVIGAVQQGDRLHQRETAQKSPRDNTVQVYNFKYPRFGGPEGNLITCIKVIDKFLNGTNGEVITNYGGINGRSLNLSVRSQLGQGLHYEIEVWGH